MTLTYLWVLIERAVSLRFKLDLVELEVREYAIRIVEVAGYYWSSKYHVKICNTFEHGCSNKQL